MTRFTLLLSLVLLAIAATVHGFAFKELMDAPAREDKRLEVHSKNDRPMIPEGAMVTGLYVGSNAYALKNGVPLPRPRSILRCPPGGCNETVRADFEARKLKKRQAPSPLPTLLPAKSGNFKQTCSSIVYRVNLGSSSTVSANCYDQTGVLRSTSINVASCLANKAGSIVCSLPLNYFWETTCTSCRMSGSVITCSCNRGNNVYQTTSYELDGCFGNNNGKLYCTNNP